MVVVGDVRSGASQLRLAHRGIVKTIAVSGAIIFNICRVIDAHARSSQLAIGIRHVYCQKPLYGKIGDTGTESDIALVEVEVGEIVVSGVHLAIDVIAAAVRALYESVVLG